MVEHNKISQFELAQIPASSYEQDADSPERQSLESAVGRLNEIRDNVADRYELSPEDPRLDGLVDVEVASYVESASRQPDLEIASDATDTGVMEVIGDPEAYLTAHQLDVLPVGSLGESLHKIELELGSPSVEIAVNVIEGSARARQSMLGWEQFDSTAQESSSENNEELNQSELEKTIESAKERAGEMSERGLERSQFDGERAVEAISTYYEDQEVTLALLESFDGVPSDEKLEEIRELRNQDELSLSSEVYNQIFTALESAQSDEGKREILETAVGLSYIEPCIGALTLEEADVKQIAERKHELLEKINPDLSYNTVDNNIKYIEDAQVATLNEVRSGGQLLFHNTNFGRAIEDRGSLQGRFAQEGSYGSSMKTTADKEGHSQLIHFSEYYEPYNYKDGAPGSIEDKRSETYAIPLAQLVEQAPISGGLERATVPVKENSDFKLVELEGANVDKVGSGDAQLIGTSKLENDRVFWTEGRSQELAADYRIPVDREGVYVLQSSVDRRVVGSEDVSNEMYVKSLGLELPEGVTPEDLKAGDILSYGYHEMREELKRYDKPADLSPGVWTNPKARELRGSVEKFIQDKVGGSRPEEANYKYLDIDSNQEYGRNDPQITEIMQESAARYDGQVVVPLRAVGDSFVYRDNDNSVAGTYANRVKRLQQLSKTNS